MRKSNLIILMVMAFVVGCGTDPDNPPRFRLHNGSTDVASVQIKTSEGNTNNINGIAPDYTSPYQNSSEGKIEITATVKGDTTTLKGAFSAYNNQSYTININNPPSVTISSP